MLDSGRDTDDEIGWVSTVDRRLAELESILSIANQAALSFSPTIPLAFADPPMTDTPPYLFPSNIPNEPNTGDLRLDPHSPLNSSIIAHERSMYSYLRLLDDHTALDVAAVANVHSRLRSLILGEISRVCDSKGREWDAQRLGQSTAGIGDLRELYTGVLRIRVNCGKCHTLD